MQTGETARVRRVVSSGNHRQARIVLQGDDGRPIMAIRTDADFGRHFLANLAGIPTPMAEAADLVDTVLDQLGLLLLSVTLNPRGRALEAEVEVSTGCGVRQVRMSGPLAVFLAQHLRLPLYVSKNAVVERTATSGNRSRPGEVDGPDAC
jgi:bifunctional DNase/RNase